MHRASQVVHTDMCKTHLIVLQEESEEEDDDVQTVITQMAALTTQSQLTVNTTAETSASVAAAINQLNAN